MTDEELIQFIKRTLDKDDFDISKLPVLKAEMQKMLQHLEKKTNNAATLHNISPKDALILFLLADRSDSDDKFQELSKKFVIQSEKIDTLVVNSQNRMDEFEKKTLATLTAETNRVNTSFTDLQTTVGGLLTRANPGLSSQNILNANELLLIHLRRTFFAEYNVYELEVAYKKQNNNNNSQSSKLHNLQLLKPNQILLVIDIDSFNKHTFELIGHFGTEETCETYHIGTYPGEAIALDKLKNSLATLPSLIAQDKSVLELLLRVIILRKLRQEGLLYRSRLYESILIHCASGLSLMTKHMISKQIANHDRALILHGSGIKSKESVHDEEGKERYSTQRLMEHVQAAKMLIETIRIQSPIANTTITASQRSVDTLLYDIREAPVLEKFHLEVEKLKKEIGKIYFVLVGNFFEVTPSPTSTASTALSTWVISGNVKPGLEMDARLLLELYEKYNVLLQYSQDLLKQILKFSEIKVRANLLKTLRFKLLPYFNPTEIIITLGNEHSSLSKTQFNLAIIGQHKNNPQYELRGLITKNNNSVSYLLGMQENERELLNEIKSLEDPRNILQDKAIAEALIQIGIFRILNEDLLLDRDKFLIALLTFCDNSVIVLNEIARHSSYEYTAHVSTALSAIAEIRKKLPSPAFKISNSSRDTCSAPDHYMELCELQSTLGKLGFIMMSDFFRSPAVKQEINPVSSTTSSYSSLKPTPMSDRCNFDDLDGQQILILHDVYQAVAQLLYLEKSQKNSFNTSI